MLDKMRRWRALNMIEVLVVLVILVAIGAFLLPRYLHSAGKRADSFRGPVVEARDTVCRSNLNQLRASIQAAAASDPDGAYPRSLEDLGMPSEILRCPTGGEAYRYDAASGRVQCPHPGHEGY